MSKHHPDGVLNFDHFHYILNTLNTDPCVFMIKMNGDEHEFVFKA